MITGSTKNGFVFEIAENAADNMEVVELLANAQSGDLSAFVQLGNMLLGTEQKKRLYDSLREADGRVPIKKYGEAVGEILKVGLGDVGKN